MRRGKEDQGGVFVTEVPSLGTVSTWLLTLLMGLFWEPNGFPRLLLVWLY